MDAHRRGPVQSLHGDTVSTDKGRAEIHFLGDNSTLVMDIGTQLAIEQHPLGAGAQMLRRIQIFIGDVWFQMEHSLTRRTLLVTPTAIGGLRGTEGLVHVEDQTNSSFSLTTGQLAISQRSAAGESSAAPGTAPKVELLNPGQEMRALRGKALVERRMKSPIVRPDVKLAAAKLPSPRRNWRSHLPAQRRPPLARTLPRSSTRPNIRPRALPGRRPRGAPRGRVFAPGNGLAGGEENPGVARNRRGSGRNGLTPSAGRQRALANGSGLASGAGGQRTAHPRSQPKLKPRPKPVARPRPIAKSTANPHPHRFRLG